MVVSSQYGNEWSDFYLFIFSRLCSICCVIMGLGLGRRLGSFPPAHSVFAPNWPSACIQTCWHSRVCRRLSNTKSEMNFEKLQEKNKTKQLINSSSFFFVLSTGLDLWTDPIVVLLRKTVAIAKITAELLWLGFTCTDRGCNFAGNTACLVSKFQLH